MRDFYKYLITYCNGDYTKIENYEKARKDDFKNWVCHHKLELIKTGGVVDATRQDLIDWGIYYDRPADELIFLTREDHATLHGTGRKQPESVKVAVSKAQKGRKRSAEELRKLSERMKGNTPWNKGKKGPKQSDESKKKRSESLKGHAVSEETREKIREAAKKQKGLFHWFTNGTVNVRAKSCPDGFRIGRVLNVKR